MCDQVKSVIRLQFVYYKFIDFISEWHLATPLEKKKNLGDTLEHTASYESKIMIFTS